MGDVAPRCCQGSFALNGRFPPAPPPGFQGCDLGGGDPVAARRSRWSGLRAAKRRGPGSRCRPGECRDNLGPPGQYRLHPIARTVLHYARSFRHSSHRPYRRPTAPPVSAIGCSPLCSAYQSVRSIRGRCRSGPSGPGRSPLAGVAGLPAASPRPSFAAGGAGGHHLGPPLTTSLL